MGSVGHECLTRAFSSRVAVDTDDSAPLPQRQVQGGDVAEPDERLGIASRGFVVRASREELGFAVCWDDAEQMPARRAQGAPSSQLDAAVAIALGALRQ